MTILLTAVAVTPAIVTIAAGLAAWLTRGSDVDPWQPGELAAMTTTPELAYPVDTGGMHRAYGQYAHEEIGDAAEYRPRHGLDLDEGAEIPPSMVPALELMTPLERARELVRQLHQAHWHPWRHLPRLERIRYVAATVAARNGVPLLLGTFQRTAVLP